MSEKILHEDIKNWLLVLVSTTLSLSILLNNIFIIISVLLIIFLLLTKSKKEFVFKDKRKRLLWTCIFFFLPLISLIYHKSLFSHLHLLEKNLPFLALPILFFSFGQLRKRWILKLFSLATISISFILLVVGLINFALSSNSDYLFYNKLTAVFGVHPIYFGMFFVFAMFFLIEESNFSKKFKILLLVYASIVVALISSKVIIIISILLFAFTFRGNKKFVFFAVALFIFFISLFSYTRERILNIVNSNFSVVLKDQFDYNEPFTGLTIRLVQWRLGISSLIEDGRLLFGVGLSNSQAYINDIYIKHGLSGAGYLGFNMHNIYVDFLIKYGVLGLIIFLSFFRFLFYHISDQNSILIIPLIIILLTGLTENIIGLNKGIVFLAFISCFILANDASKN